MIDQFLFEGVQFMAQKSVSEKPILEKVYDLLSSGKQPRTFYELLDEVVDEKLQGENRPEYLARLYTSMNLDGRFLSIGENFWGLRAWYPVEQRTEEAASKISTKRKRRKDNDDYGFDGFEEDFDDLDDDLDVDLYDDDDNSGSDDDDEDNIYEGNNGDSFEDDDEFVDDDEDDEEDLDDEEMDDDEDDEYEEDKGKDKDKD